MSESAEKSQQVLEIEERSKQVGAEANEQLLRRFSHLMPPVAVKQSTPTA